MVEACGKALEIDGGSVKGMFRRATAYEALKEYDLALKDLAAAAKLDAEDTAIPKLQERVRRGMAAVKNKEKKMFGKMFG